MSCFVCERKFGLTNIRWRQRQWQQCWRLYVLQFMILIYKLREHCSNRIPLIVFTYMWINKKNDLTKWSIVSTSSYRMVKSRNLNMKNNTQTHTYWLIAHTILFIQLNAGDFDRNVHRLNITLTIIPNTHRYKWIFEIGNNSFSYREEKKYYAPISDVLPLPLSPLPPQIESECFCASTKANRDLSILLWLQH